MFDIITLKNGLKFVVLSKLTLDGDTYLYLSSYETKEVKFIFARVLDEDTIEPVVDGDINMKLFSAIASKLPNQDL